MFDGGTNSELQMAYYKEDKQIGGIVRVLPGESTACFTFDIKYLSVTAPTGRQKIYFLLPIGQGLSH